MLFYATLIVLCIVAAAVAFWLFRTASNAGRSAYRTLSPAARKQGNIRYAHLNSSIAQTATPWGWGQRRGRADQIRSFGRSDGHHHAQPAARGRTGDPRAYQTAARSTRNVLTGYDLSKKNPVTDTSSWPYRDDGFESGGSQDRSVSLGSGSRSGKGSKKPWGW